VSDGPLEIVLASANPHKASEIVEILEDLAAGRIVIVSRPKTVGEIDETGTTLEENAQIKARVVCGATGSPALADDTGLEVDGLGGAPGVYSARYAGTGATDEENVAKLLGALEGHTDRSARFRTVAAVAFPDGRMICASGVIEGSIADAPRGSAGFGYDPIFIPGGESRSYAELSSTEKHAISHRGRALRSLVGRLLPDLA
jgi:XTP/dITP diphosphohydrolase